MTEDILLPFDLPAVRRKKVTADFEGGLISSDGGLVLLRGAERRLGLSETLAGCIREWRDPERVVHVLPGMLRFRMFAIACGYEDDWPYLWLDATYVKVREAGRIVSVAVTVAVAVNDQGRREVLGMAIGASEAETFWTEFLRGLARRGLRGLKLVISDDHKGLKAAATRILGATWQRCRVHFARNLLAHAGKQGRRVVSAFVATAFAQEDADSAKAQWRLVADQLRPKVPKLAALMEEAEHDVLAYMTFPKEHRQKLHSTNPIERLHAEIKGRVGGVVAEPLPPQTRACAIDALGSSPDRFAQGALP